MLSGATLGFPGATEISVASWLSHSQSRLSAVGCRFTNHHEIEVRKKEPNTETVSIPRYIPGKLRRINFDYFEHRSLLSLELLTFRVTICNSCDQKSLKSFVGGESFAHSQTHEFRADYSISHIFYVIEADQF